MSTGCPNGDAGAGRQRLFTASGWAPALAPRLGEHRTAGGKRTEKRAERRAAPAFEDGQLLGERVTHERREGQARVGSDGGFGPGDQLGRQDDVEALFVSWHLTPRRAG